MSPSFGGPEFRHFYSACQAARRDQPYLMVKGLRTLLHVAAAGAPLGYQDLADRLGYGYEQTAHQVGALADGRAKSSGLGLLQRRIGAQKNARQVICTEAGLAITRRFPFQANGSPCDEEAAAQLTDRVLPAFDAVLRHNSSLTVGTFCVFLSIASDPGRFAYDGKPVSILAEELGLWNLPRHLTVLERGNDGEPQSRLIDFRVNEYDRRVRLPRLTKAGLSLQCALVEALTAKAVTPPRLPHPEALDRLDSPADVELLSDTDFDDIAWDDIEWDGPKKA